MQSAHRVSAPRTAANALHSTVDSRLLLFTFLVSLVAGVLSGLAPALHVGRKSLRLSLRERGSAGGGVRLRKVIVAARIALSLILVIRRGLVCENAEAEDVDEGTGIRPSAWSTVRNRSAAKRLLGATSQPTRSATFTTEIRRVSEPEASAVAGFQLLTGGSWNNSMTIQNGSTTHDRSRCEFECGHARVLRSIRRSGSSPERLR